VLIDKSVELILLDRNRNYRLSEFWIRKLTMKHIRRADHLDKDHSDDIASSEASHAPNHDNNVPCPEPSVNESNETKLEVFIADDSIQIRNRLKEMLE